MRSTRRSVSDRQLRLGARLGDPVGGQRFFLAIDRRQRGAEQRAAIGGGIDGVRGGQRLLDRFLERRRRQQRLGNRRRIDERGERQLVAAGCRRRAKVGDRLVEHGEHLPDFVRPVVVMRQRPLGERLARALDHLQPLDADRGTARRRSTWRRRRSTAPHSRFRPGSGGSAWRAPRRRSASCDPSSRATPGGRSNAAAGFGAVPVGIENTTRSPTWPARRS